MISTFTRRGMLGIMAAGLVLLVGVVMLAQPDASENNAAADEVSFVLTAKQAERLLAIFDGSLRPGITRNQINDGKIELRMSKMDAAQLLIDISNHPDAYSQKDDVNEANLWPVMQQISDAVRIRRDVDVRVREGVVKPVLDALPDEAKERVRVEPVDDDHVMIRTNHEGLVMLMLHIYMKREEMQKDGRDVPQSFEALLDPLEQAFAEAGIDEEVHPKAILAHRQRMADVILQMRVTIAVTGNVVDEEGQPLEDVEVSVFRRVRPTTWDERGGQSEQVINTTVNDRFAFDVDLAHSLAIRFKKDGYHAEQIHVFPDPRMPSGQGVVHREDDIQVVMIRRVPPAQLVPFRDGRLEYHADGFGVAFVFRHDAPQRDRPRPPDRSMQRFEIMFEDIEEAATQIKHGVSMVVAVTDDHELDLVETDRQDFGSVTIPRTVTLRMHDPDGGFIPHGSVSFAEPWRPMRRRMRTAPETGYMQQWTFEPEDFLKRHFFYFRSQGHYGIGEVATIHVDHDRQVVRVLVNFQIQPNPGVRNVATDE